MAAWLLREVSKGHASPWAPYLATLPPHVPLPSLFPLATIQQLQWRPTEAMAVAYRHAYEQEYRRCAPDFIAHSPLSAFLWAMTVISSRTFSSPSPPSSPSSASADPSSSSLPPSAAAAAPAPAAAAAAAPAPAAAAAACEENSWGALLPLADLMNHSEHYNVTWTRASSGHYMFHAIAPIAPGADLLTHYGVRSSHSFLLSYGFSPHPNSFDSLPLFRSSSDLLEFFAEHYFPGDFGEEDGEVARGVMGEVEESVKSVGRVVRVLIGAVEDGGGEGVGESGDECEGKGEGEREGKIDGEIEGGIEGERKKETTRRIDGGNGGCSGGERRERVTICEGGVDGEEEELVQIGCDGGSVMEGGGSSGGEKVENRGSRCETSCARCEDGQEEGAVVVLGADEEDGGRGRAREERSGARGGSVEEEEDGNRKWNGKSGLRKACEAVNGWTKDEGNTDRRGGETREGSQEGAGMEINRALDERGARLQENGKTAEKEDEKNGGKQSDAEKRAEAHAFSKKPGKTNAAAQSSPEKQSPSNCPSGKDSAAAERSPATATVYLQYGTSLYGPEYSFEAEQGYAVWPHGHVDPRIMASFAALWHLFVYGREPRHHPIACASVLYCWGISHPALHPLRPRLSPHLLACLKAALDGIHARCCAVIDGFGSRLEEDEEELAGLLARERRGLTKRVGKRKNVRRVVEGGGREGPGEGEDGRREEIIEIQENEGSKESEESESEESAEDGGDRKGGIAEREAREREVVLRYRIGRKRLVGVLERRLRRSLTGGLKGMGGGELEERAVMGRLMEGSTMW
ncbi:unnamed protein product [Closterium sp. Naga37s-1]|nr:unnamed protein product [Closterium sp. Naga37s-1]